MITTHDVDQKTEEWQKLRAGKYTGSNADKLLAHANKLKIVDGVISGYSLTEISGFTGNFYTRRGGLLEDEAIELYKAIRKVEVERPGFVTNSRYPMCGYSPDGICTDRTIEVKCFKEDKHLSIYNGDIPISVLAQTHFGMLICDKPLCDLVIYHPKLPPKQAFKIIAIKQNRRINANFKRILKNAGN